MLVFTDHNMIQLFNGDFTCYCFDYFLIFSEIPGYRDVEQIWDGDSYHNKIHALLSGISV